MAGNNVCNIWICKIRYGPMNSAYRYFGWIFFDGIPCETFAKL